MGANSKTEWCSHTFNPWCGCTKVSAGCAHCYADAMSVRNPGVLGVWGPSGTRVIAAESYWRQPIAWDKAAKEAGERHRVFCGSLMDVFEGPETMPQESIKPVWSARRRLFKLIQKTTNLDWLLLTKRPENILPAIRDAIETGDDPDFDYNAAGDPNGLDVAPLSELFPNLWLGTSIEDQKTADKRIVELLKCPAVVRFLSIEPMLGPITLRHEWMAGLLDDMLNPRPRIDWVIVGGESGPHARPMHPDWARSIRDQCVAAGVERVNNSVLRNSTCQQAPN